MFGGDHRLGSAAQAVILLLKALGVEAASVLEQGAASEFIREGPCIVRIWFQASMAIAQHMRLLPRRVPLWLPPTVTKEPVVEVGQLLMVLCIQRPLQF
jgi:hypothetical protein